ncbi:MAG: hypothetical protein EA368_16825 [Leptolyngbya sp. DLM2.Bin27]|nr:MAG: hypothetical protein EA368_16825 [Leptolyngbya sp. DLM2.Bin27]
MVGNVAQWLRPTLQVVHQAGAPNTHTVALAEYRELLAEYRRQLDAQRQQIEALQTIIQTLSETQGPRYDLRGAQFAGGFAETVEGDQIGGS